MKHIRALFCIALAAAIGFGAVSCGDDEGGKEEGWWTTVVQSALISTEDITTIDAQVNGIAYGNGTYVAVGNGKGAYDSATGTTTYKANMIYSADGKKWEPIGYVNFYTGDNIYFSMIWNCVAWGNGTFVARGYYDGSMAYSSGGTTQKSGWTEVTNSTFGSEIIRTIVYGGPAGQEKFIAGGAKGKMAYSADGITWTATDSKFGTDDIRAIAWGDGLFVAVGGLRDYNQGTIRSCKMAYSADGINWTAAEDFTYSGPFNGVAYGNGTFVAVEDGDGRFIYLKKGPSGWGTEWTEITDFNNARGQNGIAYGNGKFVAVGGSYNADSSYSSDGINWTPIASVIWSWKNSTSHDPFGTVAYGNGKFIAMNKNRGGYMAYSTK